MRHILYIWLCTIAFLLPLQAEARAGEHETIAQIQSAEESLSHYLFPPDAAVYFGLKNSSETGIQNLRQLQNPESKHQDEDLSDLKITNKLSGERVLSSSQLHRAGFAPSQYINKIIFPFHTHL